MIDFAALVATTGAATTALAGAVLTAQTGWIDWALAALQATG